jgi:hypothetical protein
LRSALTLLALLAACEGDKEPTQERQAPPSATVIESAAPPPKKKVECSAPSYALREAFDARDRAAIAQCVPVRTGTRDELKRCGAGATSADLARLDAAVLPLDEATRAHVSAIIARGKKLGRKPWSFGLVGDSMTISGDFLRDFTAGREDRVELGPEVATSLRLDNGSVIDHFRGREADRVRGVWRDAFSGYRAAKSGMRSAWALDGPLDEMVRRLSPAVAIVLYGANDAAFGPAPLEELLAIFSRDFPRILDRLEEAGIVPVLNTVARHGHAPGIDDCAPPSALSNWRIAVQTNALSARVVEIACERHLPLIDLRHALDAADGRGLASDGVHLARHDKGAAKLTARGLRCGANVRNYVTLKMLAQLAPLLSQ